MKLTKQWLAYILTFVSGMAILAVGMLHEGIAFALLFGVSMAIVFFGEKEEVKK